MTQLLLFSHARRAAGLFWGQRRVWRLLLRVGSQGDTFRGLESWQLPELYSCDLTLSRTLVGESSRFDPRTTRHYVPLPPAGLCITSAISHKPWVVWTTLPRSERMPRRMKRLPCRSQQWSINETNPARWPLGYHTAHCEADDANSPPPLPRALEKVPRKRWTWIVLTRTTLEDDDIPSPPRRCTTGMT